MAQGAATSVWAAVVAPAGEVGGRYCENCHLAEIVPDDVPTSAVTEGVRAYAVDPKAAEALWKKAKKWWESLFSFLILATNNEQNQEETGCFKN